MPTKRITIQRTHSASLEELLARFGGSITLAEELDGTWTAEVHCSEGFPLAYRPGFYHPGLPDRFRMRARTQGDALRGLAAMFEGAYHRVPSTRTWWQCWKPSEVDLNLTRTRVTVSGDYVSVARVLRLLPSETSAADSGGSE